MNKKNKLIFLIGGLLLICGATIYFFMNYEIHPNDPDPIQPIGPCAYKPNIYIYPTKTLTDLKVNIEFPQDGNVIKSIPEYGDGWTCTVQPGGKINGKYYYLFYESVQPDKWQMRSGWVVKQDSLKTFFEGNMKRYGFNALEIKDFTDYWIPRFKKHPFYKIYPQEKRQIEELIELKFSEKPDDVLRLHYLIMGTDHREVIASHFMKANFVRKGYFATEWGVVLK